MGGCISVNCEVMSNTCKKECSTSSDSFRLVKSKNTQTTAFMEEVANDNGSRTSRKLCTNGTSNVACLFSQQGRKGINQDAMIVWEDFGDIEDTTFCGVFDGHGPHGHFVAQSVRDSLPLKLLSNFEAMKCSEPKDPVEALDGREGTPSMDGEPVETRDEELTEQESDLFAFWKESFVAAHKLIDKELWWKPEIDSFCSGSTAVTLMKQGRHVIIGNVGDSRAVLGTMSEDNSIVPVPLTIDLKPNLPQEAERIRQCKGRVFALHDEPDVHRVWLPHGNSPGLAMARAFGDFCLKNFGVIAVPEVTYRVLNERDQFIVLATDGIWDVLSNEEVVEIVASVSARPSAASAVVESAVHAWKSKYPTSKVDDCAVVCLYVDKLPTLSYLSEAKQAYHLSYNRHKLQLMHQNKTSLETDSTGTYSEQLTADEQISSNMTPAEHSTTNIPCPETEADNWEALEGVTRVNSLVNLPRFDPGHKRS